MTSAEPAPLAPKDASRQRRGVPDRRFAPARRALGRAHDRDPSSDWRGWDAAAARLLDNGSATGADLLRAARLGIGPDQVLLAVRECRGSDVPRILAVLRAWSDLGWCRTPPGQEMIDTAARKAAAAAVLGLSARQTRGWAASGMFSPQTPTDPAALASWLAAAGATGAPRWYGAGMSLPETRVFLAMRPDDPRRPDRSRLELMRALRPAEPGRRLI